MNLLDRFEPYAESKRHDWFDYLRIILGLFIVYKGILFTQDIPKLQELSLTVNVLLAGYVSSYVTAVHIIGGALLAAGLFTRWMCLMQLPILIGAVFFVNYPKGYLSVAGDMEFGVSIIVLAGLVFFLIMGAGSYSIDAIRRRDKQQLEPTH